MSNPASDLEYSRECLRLAADFTQLSRETLDPDVQAHCVRMATFWTDRATLGPETEPTRSDRADE
ncbi:hypothetical protein ACVIJ6_004202 [Bradyrhizobium sp. USDA 4369]